ncbi:MAG: OmpH family outer membrane protein [Candidatus Firestonebacteria bacterium]|nr:OmpH family outer membrane protein [Candidatus Firestonebacteria bacterium]
MKKTVVFAAALAFMYCGMAGAEEKLKIAVFDMAKVFNSYEKTAVFTKNLETWGNKKKAEVEAKKTEIEELMRKFYAQSSLLSDEAKKTKQKEIEDKSTEYKNKSQDIIGEFGKKEKESTDILVVDITVAAEKVAKDLKFDLLLDKKALVFGGEDITAKVIKKINEDYTKK